MNQSYIQFQIQALRATNTQRILESVMVMIIAILSMSMLPQLLMQYFYNPATLVEVPKLLEYIPVACYIISLGYTIFVVVTNMTRSKRIAQLERDLAFVTGSGTDMNVGVDEDELKELEKMVDEAISSQSSKRPARKSSKKKI